jgi:probable phosphoglycerate mutase
LTTTVLLVRHAAHGLVDTTLCGRRPGIRLSEAGRAQAERLAERLAERRAGRAVAEVRTSPLERARETAEPAARRLGLDPVVAEDLIEIDFGAWAGRRFDELDGDPAWTRWNAVRSQARPPGGETMLEAQGRIVRHLEILRETHAGRAVALVTHGDLIKAALAHHLGLSLDGWNRFDVSPASVSTLELGDWGSKVISLNEAAPP